MIVCESPIYMSRDAWLIRDNVKVINYITQTSYYDHVNTFRTRYAEWESFKKSGSKDPVSLIKIYQNIYMHGS